MPWIHPTLPLVPDLGVHLENALVTTPASTSKGTPSTPVRVHSQKLCVTMNELHRVLSWLWGWLHVHCCHKPPWELGPQTPPSTEEQQAGQLPPSACPSLSHLLIVLAKTTLDLEVTWPPCKGLFFGAPHLRKSPSLAPKAQQIWVFKHQPQGLA